jgi:peptidoglycan/xylan/chitin deacetylase (PgdA/CDA1 family)
VDYTRYYLLYKDKHLALEPNPADRPQQPLRQFHLLYHEIRVAAAAYSYVTSTGLFRQHLDLYARLRKARSAVVPSITFDDGHVSNFELAAPILESAGFPAHFFITVGWIASRSGYMDWAQVRALQRAGNRIGAHGWSHKFLTHCTSAEFDTELTRARLTLEDRLGASITTMSLPGGRCNRRVLEACKAAGYTHLYTSVPTIEKASLGFIVGRLNVRGDMQPEWLAQLFAPSGPLLARVLLKHRFKAAAQAILGDCLYARLWAVANRHKAKAESDEHSGSHGACPASPQEPHT